MEDIIYIKDLRIKTIIGIFDWERKVKQEVSIDMEFPFDCKKAAKTDSIEDTTDYKAITKLCNCFVVCCIFNGVSFSCFFAIKWKLHINGNFLFNFSLPIKNANYGFYP